MAQGTQRTPRGHTLRGSAEIRRLAEPHGNTTQNCRKSPIALPDFEDLLEEIQMRR